MPGYYILIWIGGLTFIMCFSTLMDCLSKENNNDRIIVNEPMPIVHHHDDFNLSMSNEYDNIEDFDL
jgi:hypothetical protein